MVSQRPFVSVQVFRVYGVRQIRLLRFGVQGLIFPLTLFNAHDLVYLID